MKNRLLKGVSGLFIAALSLCSANVNAADIVSTAAILQDAFANQQPAQVGSVQGAGTLYLKNQADGIRNTYIQLSLNDLDVIPDAQLATTSVKVRLYVFRANTNVDGQTLNVYPVTAEWDETTLTWNNAPANTGTLIATTAIPTGIRKSITDATSGQQGALGDPFKASQYITVDITDYAVAQYRAGNKTISIQLTYPTVENNGDTQIISKDADVSTLGDGGAAKVPALVIGVIIPTETKNLIQGGSAEAADAEKWTVQDYTSANIVATWGVTEGAPSAGQDGALHVVGTSPVSGSYAIYQAVELEADVEYSTDAAYSVIGTKNTAWVEIYIAQADPTTVGDYSLAVATGSNGGQIASLFKWDAQLAAADGTFALNANTKPKKFKPTTSGTYYFLIKFGANGADGHFDVLLDNISLTYERVITSIPAVEAKANNVYTEGKQIKVNGAASSVAVYNVSGALVDKSNAAQFVSKNLASGVYIVLVDGVASKVIVK